MTADRLELDWRATCNALIGALQSTAPVGLACLDREFRYVHVNDALAAMNRLAVGDHIGRRVCDIAPEVWDQLDGLCRVAYRPHRGTGRRADRPRDS